MNYYIITSVRATLVRDAKTLADALLTTCANEPRITDELRNLFYKASVAMTADADVVALFNQMFGDYNDGFYHIEATYEISKIICEEAAA